MRRLLALLTLAALLATPALAEVDWKKKYGNFTNTRCEDPATIADLLEAAKGLRFANGTRVFSEVKNVKVMKAKTRKATANTLNCTLAVQYTYQGQPQSLRGRYLITITPDGWHTRFTPGY